MSFNEDIQRITDEIMQDGTIEKIMREKIEKGFSDAISSSFQWGKLNEAFKKKIEEVMVPYIESYDMEKYITKLDTVLTDIVNSTALQDNAKILRNFRGLMVEPEKEYVTLEEIFKQYKDYVSKNMDTSGRSVTYDYDEAEYEPMEVEAEIVMEEPRSWSSFEYGALELSVDEEEQQESLNFSIRLSRWKKEKERGYRLEYDKDYSIHSLQHMNDFEVFLYRLSRAGVRLLDDVTQDSDYVLSETKPEATYE